MRDRPSRAEQVAADVEDEILSARLPVGAHLGRRAEFMDRFGISPTVMNETLRILRDRGLVGVRPGTGGGVFVAGLPPQVRLGAIDLWFSDAGSAHPLELFEARVHLEGALARPAFERATAADLEALADTYQAMSVAVDARGYLEGVLDFHRVLVRAARIAVLDGMHQSIVALLRASLRRAAYVDGYEPMLAHSLDVHGGIVDAIRGRHRVAFTKVMRLHDADLVRADDPRRSPDVGPAAAPQL